MKKVRKNRKKKHCPLCNRIRGRVCFSLDSSKRDGMRTYCKECESFKKKCIKAGLDPKETYNNPTLKYCNFCLGFFNTKEHFYKKGDKVACKSRTKKHVRQYIKNNPDKNKKWQKIHFEKNRERYNNLRKKYTSEMRDCYIATLLRNRSGNIHQIYSDKYPLFQNLFQKQRRKLQLEREIKKEIATER